MSIEKPTNFADLSLSGSILDAIAEAGYHEPTDVQSGVIPLVLAGIDLIVQSQTGTGKTAAFAAPIAQMLEDKPGVVQALALAPTRELALQVSGELETVGCTARGLDVLTVYGGASIGKQIDALVTAQVIVATPGRMLDLLRRKALTLDELKILVLDEADEMMSMGFEKELKAILEYLPEERQSLLFSATVTESIKDVAADILYYPEYLSFSSDAIAAAEIEHRYYMISGIGRLQDLNRLIAFEEPEAALVFCNTRDESFRVANHLKRQGMDAEVLNGELPQSEREKVMGQMKAGELQFLVATDIAARGIDISFLPCVINFILPEAAESYIHRTGRTGRAGRAGLAISLISPREIGVFYQLRRAYKLEMNSAEMPSDEEIMVLQEKRALDKILGGLDEDQSLNYGQYLSFADALVKLPDSRTRLAKLMAAFVASKQAKAEAAKKAEIEAEAIATRSAASNATTAVGSGAVRAGMVAVRINLGRDRTSEEELKDLMVTLSGLDHSDLGETRLFGDHSIVEVAKDYADDMVDALDGESVDGYKLVVSR